jgi:hypothetical protein
LGYILFLLLIDLGISLCTKIHWFSAISLVSSIGSFIAMFVVYYFQNKQSEMQGKTLETANKTLDEVDISLNNANKTLGKVDIALNETKEELKKVRGGIKTIPLEDFPDNVPDINERILQYCRDLNQKVDLEIFVDVLGYASLSRNRWFEEYFSLLREITNKPHHNLKLYIYNDLLTKKSSLNQFQSFSPENDPNKYRINDYITTVKTFVRNFPNCGDDCKYKELGTCTHEGNNFLCFVINKLNETVDYLALSNTLSQIIDIINSQYMNHLLGSRISRIPEELPFFAWFVLQDNKLQKAIISFPAYKDGANEKCFYTEDENLINVFYATIHDYVEASINKVKKQTSEAELKIVEK